MGELTRVTLHTPDERLTGFGCLTASIPGRTRVPSLTRILTRVVSTRVLTRVVSTRVTSF